MNETVKFSYLYARTRKFRQMKNSITKKDFLRLYNVNRSIFACWCEELDENFGLKKTKQTFTPRQIFAIIDAFGMPPFCSESERKYIELILKQNES